MCTHCVSTVYIRLKYTCKVGNLFCFVFCSARGKTATVTAVKSLSSIFKEKWVQPKKIVNGTRARARDRIQHKSRDNVLCVETMIIMMVNIRKKAETLSDSS